jgi:membrane-associated phospholipid phosphatase
MDPMRSVDWGAYYFFDFLAQQHPRIVPVMQVLNQLAGYAAAAILICATTALFAVRRQLWAAVMTLASYALTLALVEATRLLVARPRPDEAEALVGPEDMLGSYPARGIFLFTMALLSLTFAWWPAKRRRRVLLSLLVALLLIGTSLSQLVLRLHFVTDVVGGLFGGTACALLPHLLVSTPRGAAATITTPAQISG